MKVLSVEPTPSPNHMKLVLDEHLPPGKRMTLTTEDQVGVPSYMRQILVIEGVRSVFRVADFLSLERRSTADWPTILQQVQHIIPFQMDLPANLSDPPKYDSSKEKVGTDALSDSHSMMGIQVFVQKLHGIPMQVKLVTGDQQTRVPLPARFTDAAMQKAAADSANLLQERVWEEESVRYGDLEEIAEQVVQEISAAFNEKHLEQMTQHHHEENALYQPEGKGLQDADWRQRFAFLQRLEISEKTLPYLEQALQDQKPSIRRLAVSYLGQIPKSERVLELLFAALKDRSVAIRRTAGDALSDLGDARAVGPMIEALHDPSKLVRWRAARFLFEVGDESTVPALRERLDDPEFEVRLQARLALERIERGQKAAGAVWQQMTQTIQNKPDRHTNGDDNKGE